MRITERKLRKVIREIIKESNDDLLQQPQQLALRGYYTKTSPDGRTKYRAERPGPGNRKYEPDLVPTKGDFWTRCDCVVFYVKKERLLDLLSKLKFLTNGIVTSAGYKDHNEYKKQEADFERKVSSNKSRINQLTTETGHVPVAICLDVNGDEFSNVLVLVPEMNTDSSKIKEFKREVATLEFDLVDNPRSITQNTNVLFLRGDGVVEEFLKPIKTSGSGNSSQDEFIDTFSY
jgi:hypothetical protein